MNSEPLRALVVDSDPTTRDALADILQDLGLLVEFARGYSTGLKALQEAVHAERPFCFVFVSAHLRVGSALDLFRFNYPPNWRVKLILLINSQSPQASEHASHPELRYFDVHTLATPYDRNDVEQIVWRISSACSASYSAEDDVPSPPADPGTGVLATETPAPPNADLPMWPRARDVELPTQLPGSFSLDGFGPATARPAAPSAAPPPASSGRDFKETIASTWESLQEKVGGWFKKKPTEAAEERLDSFRKERPLDEWAKPVGTDFVEPPSRFPISEPTRQHTAAPVGSLPSPAPSEVPRDEVDCTVYAPPTVSAGETILVQAMLHLPEQANLAATLARQFDDTATARGARSLDMSIARGSRMAFQLTAPGLEIDDATPPPIIWRGRPEGVQFGVTAPDNFASRAVICTVLVTLESVPIGQIKFKLAVQSPAAPTIAPLMRQPTSATATAPQPHRMSRYQMVFISYASADRDEVLKRVQMLKRFDVKFFQDVLNLEPGERWEQALYKRIDESDLFLLFWSTAAKNSKWVREEVKYALGRRETNSSEIPEIVPIVLEGPPVPEPLPELSHLHFNDQILHFVADRYSSASP